MSLNPESDRHSIDSNGASPQGILPPIHTIPPELVGEIFTKCLEDGKDPIYKSVPSVTTKSEVSPFTLSYVCRRWRNFALSTPTLWSSVSLYEPKMAHIPLVDLWLQRSGNCPLSLTLLQTGKRENLHHESAEKIISLFIRHLGRWKDIYFRLHTPQTSLLNLPEGGAKMLESAAFIPCFWNPRGENPYVDRVWTMLHSSPALRRICWSKGYLPIRAPWTQLTHVQVDSVIDDRAALKMLQQCHDLETVSFTRLLVQNTTITEIAAVTLPYLHTLSLYCGSDPGALFQRLVLPAMETLDIRHMHYPGAPTPPACNLGDLLSRSSSPLKSLTLVDRYAEECKILDYLRLPSIQRITELHLSANIGDPTMKLLTSQPSTQAPTNLSNLKALHLRSSCTSNKVLSNMVASRLPHLEAFSTAMFVAKDPCTDDVAFLKNLLVHGHKVYFSLIHAEE